MGYRLWRDFSMRRPCERSDPYRVIHQQRGVADAF
jgi:hypothetical protein